MDLDGRLTATRIAAVVAVVLAAAYIFWGPVGARRKKLPVLGLVNIGNSCFLNAILQAIAPCLAVTTWLKCTGKPNDQTHFGTIIFNTIQALNGQEEHENAFTSAVGVLEALAQRCWVIGAGQQDAHEMYLCLTSTLEEELFDGCRVNSSISANSLLEDNTRSKVGINRISSSLPKFRDSLQRRIPFRGLLTSQLRCQKCGHRCPIKVETFDSISVTIPPASLGHLSLLGCLRSFMTAERVHDVDCEGCSALRSTQSKSTFTKRFTIAKLPDMLCVHLSRTVWVDTGVPIKRHDHVTFNEFMNMAEFTNQVKSDHVGSSAVTGGRLTDASGQRPLNLDSRENAESFLMTGHLKQTVPSVSGNISKVSSSAKMYQLKSVIEHVGDVYGGHFITYRRGPANTRFQNNWFSCSDSEIEEVSIRRVVQCTAYLLFYERHPVPTAHHV